LLNLLDAFGSFEQVREIAERSFAFRDSRLAAGNSKPDNRIWQPFDDKARVLAHFGYLDYGAEVVTESGKWLADLRIDRPLLVGEALRQGMFDELSISHMSGLMASVASDADRSYGEMRASRRMVDILADFEDLVVNVSNAEWKNGVRARRGNKLFRRCRRRTVDGRNGVGRVGRSNAARRRVTWSVCCRERAKR
jgi:superfamily II RNA helicase